MILRQPLSPTLAKMLILAALGTPLATAACGGGQPTPPPRSLVADPPPLEDGVPPGAGLADFDRGVALIEAEAYDKAIPHFDKVLAIDPKKAEAVYYRALAHHQLGKLGAAEEGYAKAIELDGQLIDARANLGLIYLAEPARPEKAVEVLAPAIDIDPKAADIRENLALAYRLTNNPDKSAEQYAAAIKLEDRPELRFAYAEMLFEARRMPAAAEQYDAALAGFKDNKKMVAGIAHRLAKAEAHASCVKAFDRAIELDAKEPSFHLYRGHCNHRLDNKDEAMADYKRATEVDDKFQPAYFYLGVNYIEAKKHSKAQWALRKAIEIDPKSPVGKKAREKLKNARP